MVFQHSRPLHRQTVGENIKLALLPDSLSQALRRPGGRYPRAPDRRTRRPRRSVRPPPPRRLPFADLRRLELAKAIARDPKVVLVDEPFAGLTAGEVTAFSALIAEASATRAARCCWSTTTSRASPPWSNRVLAMYLGERIVAEGSAEEVMANPTVRQVYLGSGALETSARPELDVKKPGPPLLEVKDVSVFYGKAQALEKVSLHVREGEFVSVVGLNGAGKTTLFNAISGLVP